MSLAFTAYALAVLVCGGSLAYLINRYERSRHVAFWLQTILAFAALLAILSKVWWLLPPDE
jgi:predicted MFS family arabinose efflux permease